MHVYATFFWLFWFSPDPRKDRLSYFVLSHNHHKIDKFLKFVYCSQMFPKIWVFFEKWKWLEALILLTSSHSSINSERGTRTPFFSPWNQTEMCIFTTFFEVLFFNFGRKSSKIKCRVYAVCAMASYQMQDEMQDGNITLYLGKTLLFCNKFFHHFYYLPGLTYPCPFACRLKLVC